MKELIEKIERQKELIKIYQKEREAIEELRDQAEGDTREDLSCEVMQVIEKIEDCEIHIREYEGYLNDPFESPHERIEELNRLESLFNEARQEQIDPRLSKILEDTKKSLPEGIDVKVLKDLQKAVNGNNKEMAVKAISHIVRVMEKIKEKSILNNRIDELNKEKEALENTSIEELIDDIEDRYCEMLDECYPRIEIGCISLNPSDVLRKMDPIAYILGMSEYDDNLAEDIKHLPEWGNIQEQIDDIDEAVKDICEEIDELDEEIAEMIECGIDYTE